MRFSIFYLRNFLVTDEITFSSRNDQETASFSIQVLEGVFAEERDCMLQVSFGSQKVRLRFLNLGEEIENFLVAGSNQPHEIEDLQMERKLYLSRTVFDDKSNFGI
jgi:hypothetical protein